VRPLYVLITSLQTTTVHWKLDCILFVTGVFFSCISRYKCTWKSLLNEPGQVWKIVENQSHISAQTDAHVSIRCYLSCRKVSPIRWPDRRLIFFYCNGFFIYFQHV